MLLATTSHITQNIASVPFLWVLPLSLYLLTFVLAFEGRSGRGWYEQNWWLFITLVLIVGMAAGLSASRGVLDVSIAVPLYTIGMFMSVLFCNGELAHRKPAPRYLTQLLPDDLARRRARRHCSSDWWRRASFPRISNCRSRWCCSPRSPWSSPGATAGWSGRRSSPPSPTGWYGIEYLDFVRNDVVFMERNFYGTLRVREQGGGDYQVRRLLHGVILHGEQFTISPDRLEPGTYYARTSGVGRAIAAKQASGPMRIGVVGLGVGHAFGLWPRRRRRPLL